MATMLASLIETLSTTVSPDKIDIQLCESLFEPVSFAKNTVIEEQHKIPQYLYFISSGFMRLFYYGSDGDEHTTYLFSPKAFVASFLSFIDQVKATENVECVTDCQLLRIPAASLRSFIDQSENFKKFSLTMFQQAIATASLRANDLATLNAEQRYRKLMDRHPEFIQNFPIQYIASYLGMKPESLSRIRRQIIN